MRQEGLKPADLKIAKDILDQRRWMGQIDQVYSPRVNDDRKRRSCLLH